MAFRSSAIANSGSGGNLTATPPSVVAGDYLGGYFARDFTATTPTYPSGYTERQTAGNSAPDGHYSFYFDKDSATGSDDFTVVNAPTDACGLIIGAWSGRNTSAPRSTTPVATVDTSFTASPISASINGITATAGDDIAVFSCIDQSGLTDVWTYSTITNYTERHDGVSANNFFSGITLQTRDNVSGGATGSLSTTATGANNGAIRAIVVAIAVAGGGSTPGSGLAAKTAPIKSLVNGGLVAAPRVPQPRKIIVPQRAPLHMARKFHSEARL